MRHAFFDLPTPIVFGHRGASGELPENTRVILVAALNIFMFRDVESMSQAEKAAIYARIYLFALVIPVVSVAGVTMGALSLRQRARRDPTQQRFR